MRILFRVNTDAEEEADVLGSEWNQARFKEAGLRMRGARMRSLGVFVVGDCQELGNWCIERAVRLSQDSVTSSSKEDGSFRTSSGEESRNSGTTGDKENRNYETLGEGMDSNSGTSSDKENRNSGTATDKEIISSGASAENDSRLKKSNIWSVAVDIADPEVEKVEYRYFIGQVVDGQCDSVHSWEANPYPRILRATDTFPGVATYGRYNGSSCVEAGWLGSRQSEVQVRIHGNDAMTLYEDPLDETDNREFYIKCLPIDLRRRARRRKELDGLGKVQAQGKDQGQGNDQSCCGKDQGSSITEKQQLNNGHLSDVNRELLTSKESSEKKLSTKEKPQESTGKPPVGDGFDDITEYITSDVQVSILSKKSRRTDPPPVVNHPYPQPMEGIPYTLGDFVTFRLRTRKPAEIGFKITICASGNSDHETGHGKSGMVLGTAFVGRCPADKSKQISECMISNEFEAVGLLKVDVLVIRPAACAQSRAGLRLARPCPTPSPSPKRLSPVPGSLPMSSSISRSLVIGHRGMGSTFNRGVPSAKVIENTLASFERAIHHGADMIEFDVMLTKDMVPVIYHDFVTFVNASRSDSECQNNVEKCSGGRIRPIRVPIQDLTLDELMSLNVESAAERDYRIGYEKKECENKCRHDSGIGGESTIRSYGGVEKTGESTAKGSVEATQFNPTEGNFTGKTDSMGLTLNDLKEAAKILDKDITFDNVSLCSEEVATVMSATSTSETKKEEAYDSDRSIDSGIDAESSRKLQQCDTKTTVKTAATAKNDCRCISPAQKSCNQERQQRPYIRSPCKFERPFPTLRDLFTQLDPRCGFNVEVKHSMQLAAGHFEEDFRSAVELNDYVDAILAVIYEHTSEDGRPVVFSSFDPDICIMLRLKQNLYPVLFLSQGEHPHYPPFADSRTRTVADAVQFARSANILGVDLYSGELLSDLKMVRHVKSSGLSVYCWGSDNNNPENMKILEEAGVDAIILDRCDEFIGTAL